jgi:hypothetical protein
MAFKFGGRGILNSDVIVRIWSPLIKPQRYCSVFPRKNERAKLPVITA